MSKPPRITGPNAFSVPLVGESFYQDNIRSAVGKREAPWATHFAEAELILEDDNEHDRFAVRVDIQSKPVGYLSRNHARDFRGRLKDWLPGATGARCRAKIVGGRSKEGPDSPSAYGIWLDLPVIIGPLVD